MRKAPDAILKSLADPTRRAIFELRAFAKRFILQPHRPRCSWRCPCFSAPLPAFPWVCWRIVSVAASCFQF